jgi:hypothetical protein
MKLLNAWSMMMVAHPAKLETRELTPYVAANMLQSLGCESCVGHADAAALYSSILGIDVEFNRCQTRVAKGEEVIVGQYIGPRLAEGATTLPEGAEIKWLLVSVG